MMDWEHMDLLSNEEVKYCIKKILEKESFMTKKNMIGSLHHITISRYMRKYKAENPMIDRTYTLNGRKRVNEHNSQILKDLFKEGYISYEEIKGKYYHRGKSYTHFIIKLNK